MASVPIAIREVINGGFAAVGLFFVLSGFILTYTYLGDSAPWFFALYCLPVVGASVLTFLFVESRARRLLRSKLEQLLASVRDRSVHASPERALQHAN